MRERRLSVGLIKSNGDSHYTSMVLYYCSNIYEGGILMYDYGYVLTLDDHKQINTIRGEKYGVFSIFC